MSLRAGSETRRWPPHEQAARRGRSLGEQSPRRGAAPLRTRYQEPRTALSLPASLAFTALVAPPRGGKVGPVGSRPQPPNHLFGARPSPAAGARAFSPPRLLAWVLRPLGACGSTRGNFDSRELGFPQHWHRESRHFAPHLASWTRERSGALLSAPPRGSGSGLGGISGVKRALASNPAPTWALDPHLDSGMGWDAPPPRVRNGAGGT